MLDTATRLQNLLDEDLQIHKTSNPNVRYAKEALSKSFLKKYVRSSDSSMLHEEALMNFKAWNSGLSTNLDPSDTVMFLWKDILHSCLMSGPLQTSLITLNTCAQRGMTGPGASPDCKTNDFVTKMFDSPLVSTSKLLHTHYESMLSPRWLSAEKRRNAIHGKSIARGSRMDTVPKDSNRNRTICIEPTLNMFYQLGAQHILRDVLRDRFNISLDDQQDFNRYFAMVASKDNSLATIDLKNASDSISMELCTFLLPKEVLDTLKHIRSKETLIGEEWVELNMISTMGNGFTFPLMTLIFASLVKAVYLVNGFDINRYANFGVFGDDIICLSEVAPILCYYLNLSGFTVNLDKSYLTGPFRESCGGDFFDGYSVRGVYLKQIEGEHDVYSIFNRLFIWSVRHGVPLCRILHSLLGLAKFRPVPRHAGYTEGFRITSDHLLSPKRNRNGALFYRALAPIARRRRIDEEYTNPDGALIGAVGGYVRNNLITLRTRAVRHKVEKRVTPCWDYSSDPAVQNLRDERFLWTLLLS